jgi:hypothetical protein
MKSLTAVIFLTVASTAFVHAQDSGKTLAATLEVYAFPKTGQAADQQSKDEAACYDWATSNTGSDPFQLQKQGEQQQQQTEQQVQQAQNATQGAGVGGAVRGAAVGALIGEIADDDAGKGAAYGAAIGGVSSRRHARRASAEAQQQAESQGATQQQATQDQIDNFKKAFSACLEAKDYLVKY